MPRQYDYLTDRPSIMIRVGNWKLRFKKTAPRFMALSRRITGLVVQALRSLGKESMDEQFVINQLSKRLSPAEKQQLSKDLNAVLPRQKLGGLLLPRHRVRRGINTRTDLIHRLPTLQGVQGIQRKPLSQPVGTPDNSMIPLQKILGDTHHIKQNAYNTNNDVNILSDSALRRHCGYPHILHVLIPPAFPDRAAYSPLITGTI